MGEAQLQATGAAVDTSHERPTKLRRARPSNISITQHENGIPPRSERSMKRESKSGLRSLFGRAKTGKADVDGEDSSRVTSRPAGIRASLADFGNWPSRLHSSRSEVSLISRISGDARPSTADLRARSTTDRSHLSTPIANRVASATWNPPPLFRVYPQAVKHATLPTCNVSTDALARLSDAKSNRAFQGTIGSRFGNSEHASEFVSELKSDTTKKLQRISGFRNNWECTSKIFVLVTSGHLLQYAAEGSFDRVPEKVLQLTRISAAYASDLIPGRHWVLRVTSTTDGDGNTPVDPKSIRSKLSTKDKRQVPNMLLVFENPESMDDWLAVLRREIESLGGKKKLSETGRSDIDDSIADADTPPGHGAVVNDSSRFSRVITRDFTYTRVDALNDVNDGGVSIRRFSTYTIDDGSTTASVVSSDGQRLDNLRDSSSSHRFSYVSSGQRTVVTSAGSSPASSPTRASFCSKEDDSQTLSNIPEVRLRPNAAAIASRRQSMQALVSSFEAPLEQRPHLYGGYASGANYDGNEPNIPSVPNFSIPHIVNKRSSLNTSAINGLTYLAQSLDQERGIKSLRKPRPTALLTSRPLSIVIDQPSPRSPCSPNPLSKAAEPVKSSLPDTTVGGMRDVATEQGVARRTRSPDPRSETITWKTDSYQATGDTSRQDAINSGLNIGSNRGGTISDAHLPRLASPLDLYSERRTLSEVTPSKGIAYRRSTLNLYESRSLHNQHASPSCSLKRSVPSLRPLAQESASQSLAADSQAKLITARRSMSQLVDGPPPAPPPSYALPPIPMPSRNIKT